MTKYMNKDLIIRKTILLNASRSKIWKILTTPEMIKQFLFGTEVVTDWKIGSEIIFQGDWEGKKYRDKGIIQKFDAEKQLQYTYWSGFSGLEDKEENYSLVTFELNDDTKATTFTVSQQGFASEAMQDHSEKGWTVVLQKIKELTEN